MPFNGSGVYVPPGADFPAVTQTIISSTKYNNVVNDIAAALGNCVTRDGQSPMTGALPLGGQAINAVALGSAPSPSINFTGAASTGLFATSTSVGVSIAGTQRLLVAASGVTVAGALSLTGAITAGGATLSGVQTINAPAATAGLVINADGASWSGLGLSKGGTSKWSLLTDNSAANEFSLFAAVTGRDVLRVTQQGNLTVPAPASGAAFIVNGTSRFTSALFLGIAGTGTGGNIRCTSDDGTDRWLVGILGTGGATSFSLYDMVRGASVLTATTAGNLSVAAPASGVHTLSGSLALTDGTVSAALSYGGVLGFGTSSAHPLNLTTSNTTRIALSAAGRIQLGTTASQWEIDTSNRLFNAGNTQPLVQAARGGSAQTSGFVLVFNNAGVNRGTIYNTSNGTFTAPVSGTYIFSASALIANSTGSAVNFLASVVSSLDGSVATASYDIPNGGSRHVNCSGPAYLSAGATVTIQCVPDVSATLSLSASSSFFSAYLIS